MDDVIMLLCCFRATNVAYNLKSPYVFVDLINFLCDTFEALTSFNVRLFFNVPGYKNISLQSDVDMQNMVHLARSFRLQLIEVMVESDDDFCVTVDDDLVHTIPSLGTRGTKRSVHQINNDPDIDLLPNYCPHDQQTFLSASWANGLTHVGQSFEGGAAEFQTVLCKYAVECGFEFKYLKNDTVRITAVCSLRESKGCKWLAHARVLDANGFFYLRKWNKEHICGVAVRTVNNRRLGSELVSDIFKHRIRDKPLTRPIDVAFDLKKNYGLEISYRVAWLGVEKARGELFGAQSASFDQLRWYSGAVMEHNPGTYIKIDCDEYDNRFECFFISFKACIDGFKHCRPLLFLDGTFLKGRFKGNLLAATSKDGNRGLFPVAFAIVGAENATNWSWFLQHLRNALGDDRTFTFISDRHVGLMEAMPIIFPNAHHAFCMQHLQRNLRDKLKYMNNFGRIGLITKFNNCAYAPTVTAFEEMVEKFTNSGKQIAIDFLRNLPPQHWANAYFRGNRYGEMSSNAAESFNNWISDARHLPITRLVDSIRTQIMRQMSTRRETSQKWHGVLCPKMEKLLEQSYNDGRSWNVSQSSPTVYEVHSHPSVMVDVEGHTCSCFQWQINGFPCSHAIVAARKSGQDLYTLIEPYFHAAEYRLTYSPTITPIPTVEEPPIHTDNLIILPPTVKRPPGRPKKKRIPSRGEEVQPIRCSRCGRIGHHNRKTCKEPI